MGTSSPPSPPACRYVHQLTARATSLQVCAITTSLQVCAITTSLQVCAITSSLQVCAITTSLQMLTDDPDYESKRLQLETLYSRCEAAAAAPLAEALAQRDAVKAEERTFCVSSRACCSSDGDGDARGSREGPATGKLAGAPWTSNINPLLKIASPISSSQLEFGECGPRTSVTNRDLKEQMNE
ncbi:unnamed protein product [Plutella xylostella]|uniref:(diamondback moth) hypothetical protein n=1 Tax=Plutella xylostella TaxID=51655 RepID=A0A8S4FZ25_PLUXY|nr:unnamed protein product [Plutella xylostella]